MNGSSTTPSPDSPSEGTTARDSTVGGGRDRRRAVWDQLVSTHRSAAPVRHLEICDSPVFAPGTVAFGHLTLLVGLHGAGKSYLLSMLESALPAWQVRMNLPIDNDHHKDVLRGRYLVTVRCEDEEKVVSVERPRHWKERAEEHEKLRPLAVTVLTSHRALDELAFVSDNYPSNALPAPVELRRLSRRELDAVKAITGHAYDWLEYGLIADSDAYFPYVHGERGSRHIDSWSMSTAEFWVHYVLWSLQRADIGELVLIDEPETSLAVPGHGAFIDEIARRTLESSCQTIVTTHADEMIGRTPPECLRLVTARETGSAVHEVSDHAAVRRALGRRDRAISTLIFLEDALAVRILWVILQQHASDHLSRCDLIDSGGASNVTHAVRIVGRSQKLRVWGVLDGDQRDASASGRDMLFLPGREAPEQQLVDALHCMLDQAARRLRVSEPEVLIALEAARFVPHQSVFSDIARSLQTSQDAVRDIAIELWLTQENIESSASRLAQAIAGNVPES